VFLFVRFNVCCVFERLRRRRVGTVEEKKRNGNTFERRRKFETAESLEIIRVMSESGCL
jgi:hypothetical protein